MKNLLYKELTLVIPKLMYLFLLFPVMLLIPHYPAAVGTGYVMLMIFIISNPSDKDLEFTASLPVRRADIVLARMLTVCLLEILTLLVGIPFAVGARYLYGFNIVGMDANFAFFGFILLGYTAFNALFLPLYFRTGYKAGIPALCGLIAYVLLILALELLVAFVPALRILDSVGTANIGWQLLALGVGLVVYVGSAPVILRAAVRNFEKVNL